MTNQKNNQKIKTLLKSLRQKKRYLLIEFKSEKKYNFDVIQKILNSEIIYFIGSIDYSKSNIFFIKDKFDFQNQLLVLRVSTKILNKIKVIFPLMNKAKINTDEINFETKVLKISSTLKKLYG